MATWAPFPFRGDYAFTATRLKKEWKALHAGDGEPLPQTAAVLKAWVRLHNGDFQAAHDAGLAAGGAGITAANKAACIYAYYLEEAEKGKLDLYLAAADRAQAQAAADPANPNAHYLRALALGRYSRGISVARALAQGLGAQVKASLEQALALNPDHAEAHVALGAFHAEVIDKVGTLIGGMTYGASKEASLAHLKRALELSPHSAIAMTEYADALFMLEGEARLPQATALYEKAAAAPARDAMQRLEVEAARAELDD